MCGRWQREPPRAYLDRRILDTAFNSIVVGGTVHSGHVNRDSLSASHANDASKAPQHPSKARPVSALRECTRTGSPKTPRWWSCAATSCPLGSVPSLSEAEPHCQCPGLTTAAAGVPAPVRRAQAVTCAYRPPGARTEVCVTRRESAKKCLVVRHGALARG